MNIREVSKKTPALSAGQDASTNTFEDSIFAESFESYMRLHGWRARAIHRTDLFYLISLDKGSATVARSGKVAALMQPGDVLVAPPDAGFDLCCDPSVSGVILAVSLEEMKRLGEVSAAVQSCLSSDHPMCLHGAGTQRVQRAFLSLKQIVSKGQSASPLATHAALSDMFDALQPALLASTRASTADEDSSRDVIDKFSRLIEVHYRSQRGLSEYCAELGVTERALRRATHRIYGLTPLQMIHARTIQEAKRLLRFTSVSVADVGAALGFEDPAYFNRFFKKALNTSPRAWRVARSGRQQG